MNDPLAFYLSLAFIVIVVVGGIHLLGYFMRGKGMEEAVPSNRAYRIARVITLAEDLFEDDPEKVVSWFYRPQPGLGDVRPVEMMDTPEGGKEVEALLIRIRDGGIS